MRHHTVHHTPDALERELVEIWRKLDNIEERLPAAGEEEQPQAPFVPTEGMVTYWSAVIDFQETSWFGARTLEWPLTTINATMFTHLWIWCRTMNGNPTLSAQCQVYGDATKYRPWGHTGNTPNDAMFTSRPYASFMRNMGSAPGELPSEIMPFTWLEPWSVYQLWPWRFIPEDPATSDLLFWPIQLKGATRERLFLKVKISDPRATTSMVCFRWYLWGLYVVRNRAELFSPLCPDL